jgi:phosphoacetylglucosamine mutase
LHHAAERYDIGVYFEANGHGTVLFSDETIDILSNYEPRSPAQDTATQNLLCLIDLINQAVGDAISDFLMVEVILAHRRWGPTEWDQGYEDLPNRLVKVNVKDRFAFKTEDAERRLVEPKGLQERVDAIVRKFEKGRSFVRPSGTEDCVRVYAEASTRVGADGESGRAIICAPLTVALLTELAAQVAGLVSDYSNGDLF